MIVFNMASICLYLIFSIYHTQKTLDHDNCIFCDKTILTDSQQFPRLLKIQNQAHGNHNRHVLHLMVIWVLRNKLT